MSTGKIKTLFSDKEKTKALFPRTKTSAVSNSEGKGLDVILENLPYFSDADSSKVASAPMNADTLGGHPASDFALAYDVENMTYEDVGAAPAGNYATESFVTNKIAEAQLSGGGSGDIDLSGYATKDDIRNIDFPVDSVNSKTGAVQLSASDVGATPLYQKSIQNGQTVSFMFSNSSQTCALVTARGWSGTSLASFVFSGYGPGEIRANIHYISGGTGVLVSVNKGSENGHGFSIKANGADLHIGVSVLVGGIPTIEMTDANALKLESLLAHPISNGGTGANDAATARANLGAAPAGYGLGGFGAESNTFNGTTKNGFYSMVGDACIDYPAEYHFFRWGVMFVENRWDALIKQTLFYNGISAIRYSGDNGATWSPLEFINPPLENGAEYRTTERIQGKAVYKRTSVWGRVEYRLDGETIWYPYISNGISISADLTTAGWYKIGTVNTRGLYSSAITRLNIGGNFNNSSPYSAVVEISSGYGWSKAVTTLATGGGNSGMSKIATVNDTSKKSQVDIYGYYIANVRNTVNIVVDASTEAGFVSANFEAASSFNESTANSVTSTLKAGYVSMKTLWENASPESEFGEQTITLNLSGYDAVEIVFDSPSSNDFYSPGRLRRTERVDVGTTRLVDQVNMGGWSHANSYVAFDYRNLGVNTNGITFLNAYTRLNANDNMPLTMANNTLIPQIIRGIKGG